jgi:transcriptional regulator with XRE-family HTH domain
VSTNYLRDQRRSRALSTAEVAARLGVHPNSVLRWERLERLPAPVHIHGLARALRVETAEIADFFDTARRPGAVATTTVRGPGLRSLRAAARIPAPRIAAALGVPAARVYNWESGRARIPLDLVPTLAAALDVEVGRLLDLLRRADSAPPVREPSELGRLRRRTGLSRAAVAARIGASRHSVGAWERGGRPPLAAVRRLARVYGVPVGVVARAAGVTAPLLLDARRWSPGDLPGVLLALREWSGLTQREVAARCGCGVDAVRSWEKGRSRPRPATRMLLETLYRLPDGELLRASP